MNDIIRLQQWKHYAVCIVLCMVCLMGLSRNAFSSDRVSLPPVVDNSKQPFWPGIIAQVGESCANASSVAYVFTYEINAARNSDAADSRHRYPYFGTYNFLNDGSENNGSHTMYADAWSIIRDNGIMDEATFGGIRPRSTKWVHGYDNYYEGMKNRVAVIDSLDFNSDGAFTFFKRWLYDHENGAENGGIFVTTICAVGVQDARIREGEEKGKYIVLALGIMPSYGQHTMTVVGYNDAIGYDFNSDGKITDSIDITRDGKVDMKDHERGAFKCANTWGTSSWDDGFVYIPYRLFVTPFGKGGTLTNRGYFITVKKEYKPQRTLRLSLTHRRRNSLALSVGIATAATASSPEKIRKVSQFYHTGGRLPMCGEGQSKSIEIGLDVTDLADSINSSGGGTYFLVIESLDGNGTCDACSLIDYTASEPVSYAAATLPDVLPAGTTTIRIPLPPALNRIQWNDRYHAVPSKLSIQQQSGTLRIRFPESINTFSLFSLSGRHIATGYPRYRQWYPLPAAVTGPVFMKIMYSDGTREYHRFNPIR